jgi:hypothetical protein
MKTATAPSFAKATAPRPRTRRASHVVPRAAEGQFTILVAEKLVRAHQRLGYGEQLPATKCGPESRLSLTAASAALQGKAGIDMLRSYGTLPPSNRILLEKVESAVS